MKPLTEDCFRLHAHRVCLLREDGRAATYEEVLHEARRVATQIGDSKKLVFVDGANSIPAIASYLGCCLFGHAVMLLDPKKGWHTQSLIDRYRPDVIVRCQGDTCSVEHHDGAVLPIHPDLAVLMPTSGSTGSPKLVKLSLKNIQSNAASIVDYLGLTESDRSITTLKPFYSYGLSVVNSHLAIGGSIVLSERSAHDERLWQSMRDGQVTNFAAVPHTFHVIEKNSIELSGLPHLRFVMQAGGRLSSQLVRKYAGLGRRGGWKLFVMYGQTEASPRMSFLPPDLAEENPGSIGQAIPGGTLSLIDDAGRDISDSGVAGEMVYEGPNIMMGYAHSRLDLGSKGEIARLHTGDVAIRAASGLFTIVGRKSRMVKAFGLRICLDEIETWLHDIQIENAVVGRDDRIDVFVQRKDGVAGLDLRLSTHYRLPASLFRVVPVDELPRLANQKIDYPRLTAGE